MDFLSELSRYFSFWVLIAFALSWVLGGLKIDHGHEPSMAIPDLENQQTLSVLCRKRRPKQPWLNCAVSSEVKVASSQNTFDLKKLVYEEGKKAIDIDATSLKVSEYSGVHRQHHFSPLLGRYISPWSHWTCSSTTYSNWNRRRVQELVGWERLLAGPTCFF